MNFCPACGARVVLRVPPGDNRPRHVCGDDGCGAIHYQNPKTVVGALPEWEGGLVLLCRRAIEPRRGYWTLPAGFLERGETMEEGACRESREEANANLAIDALYTLFSIPHIDQIHAYFRAKLLDQDFHPGEESLEVDLFRGNEIPWSELAFPVVRKTLELWLDEREGSRFRTHTGEIVRTEGGKAWPRFTFRSI